MSWKYVMQIILVEKSHDFFIFLHGRISSIEVKGKLYWRFYTNKLKIIVDFSFLLCTSVHYTFFHWFQHDIRKKSLFKINMTLCPKTLFWTFLGLFILSTFFQILQMDHQKCSLKKVFGNKVLNFGAKSPMENKSLM